MTPLFDWSVVSIVAVIGVFMVLAALWIGFTIGREQAELEAELRASDIDDLTADETIERYGL